MNRDQLNTLLNDFGKNLDISDLSFDENGYCCLILDDFVINLEVADNGDIIYFYSNVGETPSDNREAFYEMLLQANFLFCQTNGATLGISREANFVLLSYQVNTSGLDLSRFTRIVENFANTVEMWSNKLSEFSSETVVPPGDSEEMAKGIRV